MSNGWIAVDLDGTLAYYDGFKDVCQIGDPIPKMAERVKKWLAEGKDVRIFTARVDGGEIAEAEGHPDAQRFKNVELVRSVIQDWTQRHFGKRLPVTNKKDLGTIEIWDDRAVQVITNKGEAVEDQLKSCQDLLIEAHAKFMEMSDVIRRLRGK